MWRDNYRLCSIGKSRWIIRNQWHEFTNTGTFLIEFGRNKYKDRTEWILTIVGFQLVVFTK